MNSPDEPRIPAAPSGPPDERRLRPGDRFPVPPEGSLGLLALGARGLDAWRAARRAAGLGASWITVERPEPGSEGEVDPVEPVLPADLDLDGALEDGDWEDDLDDEAGDDEADEETDD